MSWQTNTVTFVRCDDERHIGDATFRIETGFAAPIPEFMAREGWTYNHALGFHRCPRCSKRIRGLN